MKKIKLIAAVSIDGAIGNDEKMLWHISEDLKNYKRKTTGNIVIVGLNTFFSLPSPALKNRTHIVVCGDCMEIDVIEGVDVIPVTLISEALEKAEEIRGDKEVYVAGGSMIYDSMIDMCDDLEITWINKTYPKANKRFPIEKLKNFSLQTDGSWISDKNLEYKYSYYIKK